MGARPSKATAPTTPASEARPCSSLSSWSDLPPELAGLVLRRFSSLVDRVRFGSVCSHWRHAMRQQTPVLPPVLPWIITSYTGIVQTIPEGEVRRLCPGKLALYWCSSENWLLMTGRVSADARNTKSRNFLENPLSGATLPLPSIDKLVHPDGALYGVTKFIVCADNLIVATIERSFPSNRDLVIVCCRPGMSSWSMSLEATGRDHPGYEDIAFNDGSIYAVSKRGDLFVHEVSEGHGFIVLSSMKQVIKGSDTWGVRRFLVVSRGGRLLMVKWHQYNKCDDYTSAFEVFEADLQMSRWSLLSSIGEQVLFVSQRCSKAIPISSHEDYMCGNRIYFVGSAGYSPKKCCIGASACGMYDLETKTYHRIVSDRFSARNISGTSWFFPHK